MKGKIIQVYAGLFAGVVLIFLTEKYNHLGRLPIWAVCLELVIMIAALVVLFMPSYLLHKSSGGDVFSVLFSKNSASRMILSSLYSLLFVLAAVRFISLYVEMLITAVNPQANQFVFAAGIIAVCAYASYKGVYTATRCALISFVIIAFSVVMIMLGNISGVELSNLYRSNNTAEFFNGAFSLLPVCILPVIFSVTSGSFSHSKRAFWGFAAIALITGGALVFFMNTVLADFADGRKFPYFILGKNASFGQTMGFDCLYLICVTLCVFVLVSLFMACINETTGAKRSGKNTIMFSVLIFVMYICTEVFPKAKELVQNDVVFVIISAAYAVILPTYAYIKFKRGCRNG